MKNIINHLNDLKNKTLCDNKDIYEVLKGAGTTFSLKIVGLIFSYAFNIIFARLYGAEIMGIFALAITVAGFFSLFAEMGTKTSMVRFVAQFSGQGDFDSVKNIYKKTLQWVLPLAVFVATLFYFLSPFIANSIFHKPQLIDPLKITTFILPFGVLIGVNTASLRGLRKIRDAYIFSTVLPPILNMVGLIVLTYFISKSYLIPIYVNSITVFIGAVYSFILWQKGSTRFPDNINNFKRILDKKDIIKTSMPMFLTSAMLLIIGMTDTFMLGMFRSSSEVGVYRVILKISSFASFALAAVNSIAAPKFSELYWQGRIDKLKKIIKFSSKFSFYVSIFIISLIFVFAKQILMIFGNEFTIGIESLLILNCVNLIITVFGPIGTLLSMTGRQVAYSYILIIGVFINIIMNYLLIPTYGIKGAAIASLISTLIWRVIASIYCKNIFNFWIGYLPFLTKKKLI